jgi:hypothetical protein
MPGKINQSIIHILFTAASKMSNNQTPKHLRVQEETNAG